MVLRFPSFAHSYRFWFTNSAILSIVLRRVLHYSIPRSLSIASIFFLLQWITYGVYTVVLYPHFFSPLRHLPSPTTGNSFFHGQWATIAREPTGAPARRWVNEVPNDGLIRYLYLFNRERLLITSPKALAEVMTAQSYSFVKPDDVRRGVAPFIGNGLILAEGDEHRLQRKSLTPAFNFRHIKQLYSIFWSKSQLMVKCIQEDVQHQNTQTPFIEIGQWTSRATLDILGVAGMGQDFNALLEPDGELNRVWRRIFFFKSDRIVRLIGLLQIFLPHYIISSIPIKRTASVQEGSRVARETCRHLIDKKRALLERKELVQKDIISVALESGAFTEEDLIANMLTFLVAGHETTASTLLWAVYLLCQHPDAQKQLRQEVHNHIPNLGSDVTSETLDHIPYLQAVCHETLRLWPVIPLTLREATVDTTIQDQFVPKGTLVVLSPWAINHSIELWGSTAGEFRPERWLAPGQANTGGATSNYAFMTFLHGPRNCIGSHFAMGEFAALLAAFVGAFEFEMFDDEVIEVKSGLTARPQNGLNIKIRPVQGWAD